MSANPELESLKQHEITNSVSVSAGKGGLPRVTLATPQSRAELYLHGAHVTAFQKNGEPPLLFMSAASQFAADKPIRGGIPICFPWFGPRTGAPAHGFARLMEWHLAATTVLPDGRVSARLRLLDNSGLAAQFPGKVEYTVTAGETLALELHVTNTSSEHLTFEECLHTYFAVGDISAVQVRGLKGVNYLDKVGEPAMRTESESTIKISSEVDRVYLDTAQPVIIEDAKLKRTIRVEKFHSKSTVVWNPWIAKAKAMPDFGDDEYHRMVCVESGNVAQNQTALTAGASSTLKVVLSSQLG